MDAAPDGSSVLSVCLSGGPLWRCYHTKKKRKKRKNPSPLVHTVVSASMDAVASDGSHCTDGSVPAVCVQQLKPTAAKVAAVGIMVWCVFVVGFCGLFVFLAAQKIPNCTFAATQSLHNHSGIGLDALIGGVENVAVHQLKKGVQEMNKKCAFKRRN